MSLYKVTITDKTTKELKLKMGIWLTNETTKEELELILSNAVVSYILWFHTWRINASFQEIIKTTLDNYWDFIAIVRSNKQLAEETLEAFNSIFNMVIKEIELPDTVEELLK